MIGRYFDSVLPPPDQAKVAESAQVRAAAEELHAAVPKAFAACRFHAVLEAVLDLTAATNKFIDVTEPFKLAKLAKDPAGRDRLACILYTCAEAVRIVLLYLHPFMPETAERGLAQLGWSIPAGALSELGRWGHLPAGTRVQKTEGLFPRKT